MTDLPVIFPPAPVMHREFTAGRRAEFCEHLSHSGNVRAACRALGISPDTAYRAKQLHPHFRNAWEAALVLARDHAEAVLAERALDGVEEVIWYHGEEVGRRRRYDSALLLAHLARLDARTRDYVARRLSEDFGEALDRVESEG